MERRGADRAAGLRNAIAHDDTGGESPLPAGNWVLLAEHDGKAYFGQRTGAVGINATVTMEGKNGVWVRGRSGGCGAVGYADGRSAQLIGYLGMGRTLLVFASGGACGDFRPPTVYVHEHLTSVGVLAISQPPLSERGFHNCAGLPVPATVVTLSAPLGTRTVRDIGYVPPRSDLAMDTDLTSAQPPARFQAAAACTRAAQSSAGQTSYFVTDVATARAAEPAVRRAWANPPAEQAAGLCYQANADGSYIQRVATAGAAPVVLDAHYIANPLAVVPGQPPPR